MRHSRFECWQSTDSLASSHASSSRRNSALSRSMRVHTAFGGKTRFCASFPRAGNTKMIARITFADNFPIRGSHYIKGREKRSRTLTRYLPKPFIVELRRRRSRLQVRRPQAASQNHLYTRDPQNPAQASVQSQAASRGLTDVSS